MYYYFYEFCAFSALCRPFFPVPARKELFYAHAARYRRDQGRIALASAHRMTLFYLLITLVLDMINSGVSYMIDSAGGFTVLSFSFVSILVGLVALVLNAGYYCYCFGILRREEMPYESLFDAFPFAGKVILLSIVEGVFIFLWSMLSSSPASSRPTATRSPC